MGWFIFLGNTTGTPSFKGRRCGGKLLITIEFRNSGGYNISKSEGCSVEFAIVSKLRYSLTHPGTLLIMKSLTSSTTELTGHTIHLSARYGIDE